MKGNRTGRGYFPVAGAEPVAKKMIGLRLPASMDAVVREVAGDDLTSWIREAIAEKLEREQQMSA